MKFFKSLGFLFLICSLGLFLYAHIVSAEELTLSGSNSIAGTSGNAMAITDLQIVGPAGSTTPVKLRVTSGTLAFGSVTGLTFTGSQSGNTLYFSGTVANINAALTTLTYTRVGTGSDTLEVSLVNSGEVFFADNGHLYQYISDAGTWNAALTKATVLTRYGAVGYLTTITSQSENDFVAARLADAGWMGASDSASEGDWKWVTGPETGTSFWTGVAHGSTVGGNYANWGSGEPNQSGEEDCGQFLSGGSGKWNDLPCGSTSLPGYVVEFGAPHALPTVVAKNISITTSTNPVVNILTPLDNATNVSVSNSLSIKFNKVVVVSTGNVTIKKTTDDTTVEVIDVQSSQITGTGTDTITINPASNFEDSFSYYILIDSTAFKDGSNNLFAGISNSTVWNFTTGDFSSPLISNIAVTPATSTASVSWTTNELASSQVNYGITASYGTSSPLINTSPRVLSHTTTLNSLLACTTYHYSVASIDAATNNSSSSDNTFITQGCVSNSTPTSATTTTVTTSSGGTTTLNEGDSTITVITPADFTTASSSVVIQIQALPNISILEVLGMPSSLILKVGNIIFDVKAIIDSTTIVDSFDIPVTITYNYSDSDIAGLDESTLTLYHYHNNAWAALDSCSVDQDANTISCTAPHFSLFSLFGQRQSNSDGRSSGFTVQSQVKNLIAMGKTHEAEAVKNEWPQIFQLESSTTTPAALQVPSGGRDLTVKDEGEDVKQLQLFLIQKKSGPMSAELTRVGATGYFGIYTKNALGEYQKAQGILPHAGYYGPITRAHIGN